MNTSHITTIIDAVRSLYPTDHDFRLRYARPYEMPKGSLLPESAATFITRMEAASSIVKQFYEMKIPNGATILNTTSNVGGDALALA